MCKDGFDCEGGTQIIDFASLRGSSADGDSNSHTQAIAIVAVVLILAVIVTILLVVYYRRRLNRVEKDLQNRSVLYIENSVLTPDMQARKHDMVIRNVDPYDHISSNRIQNNTMEMATSGAADALEPPTVDGAVAASPRPEKNVNIDRFKLGEEEVEALLEKKDQDTTLAKESSVKQKECIAVLAPVNVNDVIKKDGTTV